MKKTVARTNWNRTSLIILNYLALFPFVKNVRLYIHSLKLLSTFLGNFRALSTQSPHIKNKSAISKQPFTCTQKASAAAEKNRFWLKICGLISTFWAQKAVSVVSLLDCVKDIFQRRPIWIKRTALIFLSVPFDVSKQCGPLKSIHIGC